MSIGSKTIFLENDEVVFGPDDVELVVLELFVQHGPNSDGHLDVAFSAIVFIHDFCLYVIFVEV